MVEYHNTDTKEVDILDVDPEEARTSLDRSVEMTKADPSFADEIMQDAGLRGILRDMMTRMGYEGVEFEEMMHVLQLASNGFVHAYINGLESERIKVEVPEDVAEDISE